MTGLNPKELLKNHSLPIRRKKVEGDGMRYQTRPKNVTVKTVDGMMLTGKVNLGSKERLSDVFTKDQSPFVILYDVIFEDGRGDTRKVLFMNKNHIAWAEPDETN